MDQCAGDFLGSPTISDSSDQKRRSSSRSIKRKRFDDEIVEYSLGLTPTQMNRVARARTQSQSYVGSASAFTEMVPSPVPVSAPVATVSIPQTQMVATVTPVMSAQPQAPPPVPREHPVGGSAEKRRTLKSSKKNRRSRGSHQVSTKDLGRWKPIDDLALIIGIQQTNDLKMVHRGTKFSCKFTVQELQARWYSLLYEESISRIAVAAMRNLHPELVENIQSKALYTTQEEDLLGTIKSTANPTLETFQELLDKNPAIFYPARTAKSLQTHWNLMKQYTLLPDQVAQPPSRESMTFSDTEELINDAELVDLRDEALEIELALADRRNKREIRQLENELSRWTVLVDSLAGIGFTPEFDKETPAVLRGRLVRYLMRSREITVGRCTKDFTVDVDLKLEGPAHKVSRKQATIKLRSNGDFFMTNEGKRAIYVDGNPLLNGAKTRLNNNSVIELCGLRLIFLINYDLINAIRQESAKMNIPLT
ncbi:microspherule protein 1 isoform X2 [Lutzomyia longipalpis]|uniref:microspherule protein 1 isoform X2 n=1 Tax=Lutzomyia longipalpis TaxID=7200 RepID=UPI002483C28E|nr:microspherule protein 1 isoform X2 [Lutzomyia longipalpis]